MVAVEAEPLPKVAPMSLMPTHIVNSVLLPVHLGGFGTVMGDTYPGMNWLTICCLTEVMDVDDAATMSLSSVAPLTAKSYEKKTDAL